ncbi:MAG: hypothetical protein LBI72_13245 [Flavobacteriaceae bacterium]|jgi:hypothetical protein|nr:hypothetical protein [Flavobacteriaceae bacterium]
MKKYYIPGMFSIILLPIMCIWYFNYRGFLKESIGMEVYVIDNDDYDICDYIDPFQGGKYYTYRFTGNLDHDNQVILNAKNKIDELISENNTIEKVNFK